MALKRFLLRKAFVSGQWQNDVYVAVDDQGMIAECVSQHIVDHTIDYQVIDEPVIPGFTNLHSHAFQYAFAGLAEQKRNREDSFWSWRSTMYQLLMSLKPEHSYAIAKQLYITMLKAGYTQVGEFHYIHHDADGQHYDDIALLSKQSIQAAVDVGMAICHMPVFYQYTGFDRQPLQGAQVRFGNTFDSFQKLLEAVSAFSNGLPSVSVGLAAHSLRAVDKQGLDFCQQLSIEQNNCPIHIHIAEQIAEVQACQAYLGATPIQYLSEQVNLDQNWCLVHATHTTEDELAVIAESGATVGLCVTTEANLGDGIFPGKAFHAMKGQWGIGSDSHISVNPWDELRWLEYTQRLVSKQRTVFARDEMPHTGQFLFEQAVSGGASALRSKAGRIAAGYRADLLCLDEVLSTAQNHFDYWIFAANRNPVKHVLVGGEWVIKNGQHHEQAVIREAFINVLAG